MKTLKTIVIIGLLGLLGCGGSSSSSLTEEELIITEIETGHQKTTFLITDAPSDDFKSVRVDILSPIVVTTDRGDISIPLPDGLPIRVDLLALNGVSDLLTSQVMPAETVKTMTLTLAHPEIVLLDGTILDDSKIKFTSVLTIPSPMVISEKQGGTIEIDIDVEKSVQWDVADGKPIFRPQGTVRRLEAADLTIDVREIVGSVAAVPGMKEQPHSFLLRHPERNFYIPVDASKAMIYNPDKTIFEEMTPGAITKGQRVRVSGFFTADGVLKARRVLIIPENHRVIRGMIMNLDQTTLTLQEGGRESLFASLSLDSNASSTVVYSPDKTIIRLERPDVILQPGDLAKGQVVSVHGFINPEGKFEARVIVLHPERFFGFIAPRQGCTNQRLQLVYPPRLAHRLRLAGIESSNNIAVVEVGGSLTNLQGQKMDCADLRHGMAVNVFGRIVPPSSVEIPVQIKALEIKEAGVNHIIGEVTSVKDQSTFVIKARVTTQIGFDRLDGVSCTSSLDAACFVEIKVVRPDFVPDPGTLLAVGKKVSLAGFFESRLTTLTTVREFLFWAVVIEEAPVT